jgi:hypothetical protein
MTLIRKQKESMKKLVMIFAMFLSCLTIDQVYACMPYETCIGILTCLGFPKHASSIRDAIGKGDGNGVGVDTAACWHLEPGLNNREQSKERTLKP